MCVRVIFIVLFPPPNVKACFSILKLCEILLFIYLYNVSFWLAADKFSVQNKKQNKIRNFLRIHHGSNKLWSCTPTINALVNLQVIIRLTQKHYVFTHGPVNAHKTHTHMLQTLHTRQTFLPWPTHALWFGRYGRGGTSWRFLRPVLDFCDSLVVSHAVSHDGAVSLWQ